MSEVKRKAEARANGTVDECGSCRFFRRIQVGQPGGVCRARPPVPMVTGMIKHPVTGEMLPHVNTYWPQIPDSEWCGGFERRPYGVAIDLSKLDAAEMGGEG